MSKASRSSGFDKVVSALAWVALIFLIFPVVLTAVVSFNDSFMIEFPPKAYSLKWYWNIANIHAIGVSTLISASIAFVAATLCTVLAIGASLAISRYDLPGKSLLTAFLLSPITVPMVAIGTI